MKLPAITPGPWAAERVDYELHGLDASFEVNADFRAVVQTHMREIKSEGDWLTEDEANAKAIAAVPAMIEALLPFAAIAEDGGLRDHPDSYAPRPSRGRPNMGDFRKALAALRLAGATGE